MRTPAAQRAGLLTGTCLALAAAAAPFGDARAQQQSTPFRPERFDEEWPRGAEAPFGAQFKNLPIGEGATLSFGGDLRWRFAALDAPNLSLGGEEDDAWMLQRLLLHADLRLADEARFFLQIGAHDGIDREIPSLSDDDGVDLQQAFLDLHTRFADTRITARIGRQELALGPRFVNARDGPNVRQRHDLVRLMLGAGPWKVDVFGGHPTQIDRGAFDDSPDLTQDFVGARLHYRFGGGNFETYAYKLDRDDFRLSGAVADDERTSLGARITLARDGFDVDAEIMAQAGAFGDQDIAAFGAAIDLGRRFEQAPWRPRLGARATYGSGDRDLADDEQNAFAPPFANGQWFGQNGLSSFTNVVDVAATLSLEPRANVSANAKVGGVWRADTADFLYTGGAALAGTAGGDDAFVGVASSLVVIWRVSPNVTLAPYVSYMAVGDDLASRGARDVAYAHLQIGFRF